MIFTGGIKMPSSNALSAAGQKLPGCDAADVVLVQAVGRPAEQRAFMEHRTDEHDVHLVRRADPRIVGGEHVAITDARVVRTVLEYPLSPGCPVTPDMYCM